MNQSDLAFVLLGQQNNPLYRLFVNEFQEYFPKANEFMNLYNLEIPINRINEVNWIEFLNKLPEEYVIFQQQDMIFYDNVNIDMLSYYREILRQNQEISCIRLSRSGMSQSDLIEFGSGLYYIPDDEPYPFIFSVTLWRKKDLINILSNCVNLTNGNDVFRIKNCKGLIAYSLTDTKRGMYHWENQYYPFMNTVVVNGQWNMLEYPIEIENLKREYEL